MPHPGCSHPVPDSLVGYIDSSHLPTPLPRHWPGPVLPSEKPSQAELPAPLAGPGAAPSESITPHPDMLTGPPLAQMMLSESRGQAFLLPTIPGPAWITPHASRPRGCCKHRVRPHVGGHICSSCHHPVQAVMKASLSRCASIFSHTEMRTAVREQEDRINCHKQTGLCLGIIYRFGCQNRRGDIRQMCELPSVRKD